uniref:Uncharacterized protein n=1 Tax=Arundo donax TaxID=35708 RepID=A0A0A9HTP9_ARUDO
MPGILLFGIYILIKCMIRNRNARNLIIRIISIRVPCR